MKYSIKSIEPFANRCIQSNASIRDALMMMDRINKKLLLVFKKNKFVGVLSIGDIQKAIVSNFSLDSYISLIMRKDFVFAKEGDDKQEISALMKINRIECMPVINNSGMLVDLFLWEDIFETSKPKKKLELGLPVVIMAGGKGERLKPLTNVLPKPLIPIGNKTIIEIIMDKFCDVGYNKFYISINYKSEIIRHYFSTLNNSKYQIEFIQEEVPLGTAGSLQLLNGKLNTPFFVSNCDILIEQDICDIFDYHQLYNNEITVVAALKNLNIPYGILETSKGEKLTRIIEKPDITFKINTGFYILEPHLLGEIPNGQMYHITTLMEKLISKNRKVGVFPVSEKSWTDIGEWSEYRKMLPL